MIRTRNAREQIVSVATQYGIDAHRADLCRKHGMSEGTSASLDVEFRLDDGFLCRSVKVPESGLRRRLGHMADGRPSHDLYADSPQVAVPA